MNKSEPVYWEHLFPFRMSMVNWKKWRLVLPVIYSYKDDLQQIVSSPAPAPMQLALLREKVNAQFRELLGKGFETCFGGLFLIIPFLLQIKVWRFARGLWEDSRPKFYLPYASSNA